MNQGAGLTQPLELKFKMMGVEAWSLLRDLANYGINQSKTKNGRSIVERLELSIPFL